MSEGALSHTNERLSVLIVHNRYQRRGGEDSVVAAEIELLRSMNMQVATMMYDSCDTAKLYELIKRPDYLVFNPCSYHEARTLIRAHGIQVVHCHNLFPLISTSVYAAARDEGVPIVQTVHNYRMACMNGLLLHNGHICERCRPGYHAPGIALKCYRGSYVQSLAFGIAQTVNYRRGVWEQPSIYVAPGQLLRTKLIAWGIPAERIIYKPHFVAEDPGVHVSLGTYALFIGRLAPEKGVDVLIEAWSNSCLPLVIVGDGPLRSQLERRVREKSLTNVRFVGQLLRDGVSTFLHSARFLVMPSMCLETFGMVIIEAYAHGVPVIATRLGAMADLVHDHVTGRLFARNDCADLAAKIGELERDTSRVVAMSAAARREYERLYSAPAQARQLHELYQHVITDGVQHPVRPTVEQVR